MLPDGKQYARRMLSIEMCQQILNNNPNGRKYARQDVETIRNLLDLFADIEFENYQRQTNEKESNPLHQSIHR